MHARPRLALLLAVLAGGCARSVCTGTAPPSAPAGAAPAVAAPAPEPMTGALPGDRIPGFRTAVRRPDGASAREEPFDSRGTKSTTVYIVNSTTCPYCNAYAGRMREIEATYMARGVDVVHVYPNRKEPAAEKIAWHAEQGFRGGQILDVDASIARLLEADLTPTAFVADAGGILLYRGAIDDAASEGIPSQRYLADALDAHLAGRPVAVRSTEPEG